VVKETITFNMISYTIIIRLSNKKRRRKKLNLPEGFGIYGGNPIYSFIKCLFSFALHYLYKHTDVSLIIHLIERKCMCMCVPRDIQPQNNISGFCCSISVDINRVCRKT
jgi:hypothetical protein